MDGTAKLTRRELYAQVWSRPMRDLAREFGISDVALKKTCKRHDIPTPERGYWAKRAAGKIGKPTPLPEPKPNAPATISIGGGKAFQFLPQRRPTTTAMIQPETVAPIDVNVGPPGQYEHPLVLETARLLTKADPNSQGWIVPSHGSLHVKVSRAQLARALSMIDALFRAATKQGWTATNEFLVPRRRSVVGTFWYPGVGWTRQLPTPRPAEMGVVIRRQFVAFSIVELGREVPPTAADIRAWRKQWPYGVGDPAPQVKPSGELLLEIGDHPRVITRRRFRDSEKKPLEEQLSNVMTAFAKMATGLRADALEHAKEHRQRAITSRRQRDEEFKRKALERDVAHLESGLERWLWGRRASEFLAWVQADAERRGLAQAEFRNWFSWAEDYVQRRSMDAFFTRWAGAQT